AELQELLVLFVEPGVQAFGFRFGLLGGGGGGGAFRLGRAGGQGDGDGQRAGGEGQAHGGVLGGKCARLCRLCHAVPTAERHGAGGGLTWPRRRRRQHRLQARTRRRRRAHRRAG